MLTNYRPMLLRRERVSGPTTPTAESWLALWKEATACSVAGPK
jgi:hypothetical protein